MSIPILATKIHIPPPRPELVRRSRLLDQLDSGLASKLTLISAPAGFGKTTLLSTWAAQSGRPVAWLSLDERDNDPVRFLTYVVAALQTIDANLGLLVIDALNSGKPSAVETLLTSLLNDIAALTDDFLLVLDDYHALEAPEVDRALVFLLDHLPAPMHLVIATREDPQLPLARLRVRHQLNEVRGADLRFTAEEAADFLNLVMGLALSAEDVAALENRTEGWIAGLQLAALSLQGRADSLDFIQAFTGSHRFVVDYLIEEVLHRQPDDIRRFLLHTSILDRLSSDLCDAVMASADSQRMLEKLERGNLFVVALDDERRWYRYHHLFADALRDYLLNEEADIIPRLHSRAAGVYAAAGWWDEAIQHALLAGEADRAAAWVAQTAPDSLRRGDLSALNQRLRNLPAATIQQDLTLSLIAAWSQALLPLPSSPEIDVDALEDSINSAPDLSDEQRQTMWAEIQVIRVLASADAEAARRASEQILARLPPALEHLRPIVINQIAHIHRYNGHYGKALSAYEKVIHSPYTDALTRTIAYANLGRLYQLQNRLTEARALLEPAIHAPRTAATPPTLLGFVHVALAWIELEQGQLDAALAQIELALPLCKLLNYTETLLYAEWTAAFIHLLRGDPAPVPVVPRTTPDSPNADVTITVLGTHFALRFARLTGDAALMQQALTPVSGMARVKDIRYELEVERALTYLALNDPDAAQDSLDRLRATTSADDDLLPVYRALIQSGINDLRGDTPAAIAALRQALAWALPQNHRLPFMTGGDPLAALLKRSIPDLDAAQRAFVEGVLTARAGASPPQSVGLLDPLSDRELDVLRLLGTDLSGPEIADELIISLSTMRTHTRSIYSKLDVNSRRAAVRRAEEIGLL